MRRLRLVDDTVIVDLRAELVTARQDAVEQREYAATADRDARRCREHLEAANVLLGEAWPFVSSGLRARILGWCTRAGLPHPNVVPSRVRPTAFDSNGPL